MSFAEPEFGVVDIPDDLIARVKPELRPGERLIWAGRPIRIPPVSLKNLAWAFGCLGILYLAAFIFVAIAFGAFADRWLASQDAFAVFGTITAVLAGVATIAWSLGGINSLVERRRILREIYALTDQRAMLWIPGESRNAIQFFTHDRGHFDRLHREERPDGSGSLTFSNSKGRFNPGPQQFREIPDVKHIEALARQYVILETPESDQPRTSDQSANRRDIDA